MSFVCLMAFVLIGQEPAIKAPNHMAWDQAVKFKAELIDLGENDGEIITIRMVIKPKFWIIATPQSNEFLHDSQVRLIIRSKDPDTQFEIRYPKGIEFRVARESWTQYQGDVVITALVRRAKGDVSPLQCTLHVWGSHDAY